MSSDCKFSVALPYVGLQCVTNVFPDNSHLPFMYAIFSDINAHPKQT